MQNRNRIVFFSKAVHREAETIPVHKHGCYELVYYLQGEGSIEISGVSYPFTRNTLSFSRPESWQLESHKKSGELLFFGFEAQDAQGLQEGVYSDDSQRTMLKIVSDISHEVSHQQTDYEKMLSLKIEEMLIFLRRCGKQREETTYSLDYSVNYIRENYPSRIEFRNLSAACGYSYDYFRHQFQKRTGFSPQQYLIQTRLKAAAFLLTHQNWSCTEIAYRCGFSNSAQFSAMFKQSYGISPREYRKNRSVLQEIE